MGPGVTLAFGRYTPTDGTRTVPVDDVSIGELTRQVSTLVGEIRDMRRELGSLSNTYSPRSEHELVIGGIKVDLRRIENTANAARGAVEALDDKLDARFRTAVTGVVVSFIFPVIAGLVLYLMLGAS